MNCHSVDQLVENGVAPQRIHELAGSHICACPRCQPLLDFLFAPLPLPAGTECSELKILDRLKQDLKPVAAIHSPATNLWRFIVGGLAVIAVVCLVKGIASPELAAHKARVVLTICSLVLFLILAASITRLMRPAAPPPIALTTLILNGLIGYPLLASLLYPLDASKSTVERGFICLCFGLITSALAGAVLWRLSKRGYASNPILFGTVLGALAGATGLIASEWVCCPDNDGVHFLFWHGMSGVLSVVGGSFAGYLASRRRLL